MAARDCSLRFFLERRDPSAHHTHDLIAIKTLAIGRCTSRELRGLALQ